MYLGGQQVFTDKAVFSESYIPPELRVRAKEAEMLFKIYYNKLFSTAGLSDITIIYGSIGRVGIGKTTIAKYVARMLRGRASKEGIRVNTAYVNLFTGPSLYSILSMIVRDAGFNITVRGSPVIDILKAIVDNLYINNSYLLVILDEFQNMLTSPRVNPEDLYALLRVHEEVPSKDGVARIGFILVASDIRALSYMRDTIPQVESQISFKLHMPAYRSHELYEILRQRAELGLRPGSWSEDILMMISETYGEDRGGDGSARRAIMALRMAGEMAEAQGLGVIEPSLVRKALAEQEASSIPVREIESLGIHELLILKAVADATMEGIEILTAGELRKRYELLCESYNVKPRGYTQFYNYIRLLSSTGLIESRLSGKGMRGRTTLIRLSPPIPADRLKEVVEKAITLSMGGEG